MEEARTTRDAVSLDRAVEYLVELKQRVIDARELLGDSLGAGQEQVRYESREALDNYWVIVRKTVCALFDVGSGDLRDLMAKKLEEENL